jgi:hypothetical protein
MQNLDLGTEIGLGIRVARCCSAKNSAQLLIKPVRFMGSAMMSVLDCVKQGLYSKRREIHRVRVLKAGKWNVGSRMHRKICEEEEEGGGGGG